MYEIETTVEASLEQEIRDGEKKVAEKIDGHPF